MARILSPSVTTAPAVDEFDDSDDDTASDTSSVLTEIDSDDIASYFVERDGRLFPSSTLMVYPLPIDGYEQSRLKIQHELLRELLHDNYVGPVKDVLRPSRPQVRALDLCTGTGNWVLDMAREFPDVKFTGMDMVPIATRRPPRNVDFELTNVVQPLRFPAGSIDLVHARQTALMTYDNYVTMIDNASTVLRPGGLILLGEWGRHPLILPPSDRQIPFAAAFHHAYADCLARVKGITEFVTQIPHILHQTHAFQDLHVQEHFMPIGTWSNNFHMKNLGEQFGHCRKIYLESTRYLLRQGGYSDSNVDSLIQGYSNEIGNVHGLVAVYYTIWATRL